MSGIQRMIDEMRRLDAPALAVRQGAKLTDALLALPQIDSVRGSGLMLGLGERDNEIMQTMDDLREAGVDILTLGQYLRPTPNHLAVERYVTPDEFDLYRREGLEKGFLEVVAGPMVRSSYRAEQVLQKNNVGLAV